MQTRFSDDKVVFKAIRERDPDVFVHLRKSYFGAVRFMIRSNSGCDEDAEDVYSEGIVRLIELFDTRGQMTQSKLATLFIEICKNIWLNVLRSRRMQSEHANVPDDTFYEEQFEKDIDNALQKDILWQSFNKLKDDCQLIIRSFLDGMRIREIAKLMGLSTAYVNKKKHYCHKSLLDMIYTHPDYVKIKRTEMY